MRCANRIAHFISCAVDKSGLATVVQADGAPGNGPPAASGADDLEFEPIPDAMRHQCVRVVLPVDVWRLLRKMNIESSGTRCAQCGADSQLECHETRRRVESRGSAIAGPNVPEQRAVRMDPAPVRATLHRRRDLTQELACRFTPLPVGPHYRRLHGFDDAGRSRTGEAPPTAGTSFPYEPAGGER